MSTEEPIEEVSRRIILPEDDWSNSHARSVVQSDFSRAESYRIQNHDWRWERCDRRYLGVVPEKMWEGTNIKRANISVMTAYETVESALPPIIQAIFGDDPWFDSAPIGDTSPEAARVGREIIAAQLQKARVRKMLKLALKSGLIYGNGILESCWYYQKFSKKTFKLRYVPETESIVDPFTGLKIPRQTGTYRREVMEEVQDIIDNRPTLNYIPLTQFYIDPNCPSTDINDSQYTCVVGYEPIGNLVHLRDEPGYDIPADDELIQWAKEKTESSGDIAQREREANRQADW